MVAGSSPPRNASACKAAMPPIEGGEADVGGLAVPRRNGQLNGERRPRVVAVETVQIGAAQATRDAGQRERADNAAICSGRTRRDGELRARATHRGHRCRPGSRRRVRRDSAALPWTRRLVSQSGATRSMAAAAAVVKRSPSSSGVTPPGATWCRRTSPPPETATCPMPAAASSAPMIAATRLVPLTATWPLAGWREGRRPARRGAPAARPGRRPAAAPGRPGRAVGRANEEAGRR